MFYLLISQRIDVKKPSESCSLIKITSEDYLTENNFNLVDFNCVDAEISENCLARKSFVIFACKDGFRFDNSLGKVLTKLFLML